MEKTNQSKKNSLNCVVSVSNFDADDNLIQSNLFLSTKGFDRKVAPNIECFATDFDDTRENPNKSPSVEKLCILFFKDHDKLNLAGMKLEKIQMYAILQTIVKCNYNCAQAARKLGLSKKTIYTKIKMYRRRFGQMIRLKLAEKKRAASLSDTTPKE